MQRMTTLAIASVMLASCKDPADIMSAPSVTRSLATDWALVPAIAFTSTRDNLSLGLPNRFVETEIYLMAEDFTNVRRLTANTSIDAFPTLSPDGKRIVFDSNRLRVVGEEPLFTSDLFVMNTDGTEQTFLVRGGSPTWRPDGKVIAFHASASGMGVRVIGSLGAATTDSDIFIINVDDALAGIASRINLTNNPGTIDDDPDWSPDGTKIAFTSHAVDDPNHANARSAELYVMNADGTGTPTRLTFNNEEERAPSWSPDNTRIAYSCRTPGTGTTDFEICVLTFNADGSTTIQRLTDNTVADLTVSWSRDGQTLLFHSSLADPDQLFTVKADGSEAPVQRTFAAGASVLAKWGVVRVKTN